MNEHARPTDLFYLAHHQPYHPQVWRLRYRTARGERARAEVHLQGHEQGHELLARVRRGRAYAELRSRDLDALADLLNADREHLAAPFRRVR